MKKAILVIIVLINLISITFAQTVDVSSLPKIPAEKLMEDYQLLEKMILKVHPGVFRYHDEREVRKELKALKSKFQSPLTHAEAYLEISKVTAFLQCDQTQIGNNQTKLITTIIHEQKDKIPFVFRWIDGEMILTHNASANNQLKRGTKILTINNVKVEKIKTAMIPYIAADGATDGNRIRKMENNAFDVFYPLLYPFKEELTLDVIFPNEQKISQIKLKSVTIEERSQTLNSRYPTFQKSKDDLWKYEVLDKKTGVLTIHSLVAKSESVDYKKFLTEAFKYFKSKKVKRLIIDIRENTGSDEMKKELFSYLRLDAQKMITQEVRTRYTTFPEQLKPYIKPSENATSYDNLKPDGTLTKDGYYMLRKKESKLAESSKSKKGFKGNVYLLTSSLNTSHAYDLALDFRVKNVGTIVGQETGGNLQGINDDQILYLTLPNSEIKINFPIIGTFTIGEKNNGLMPDVEIKPTYNDILNNVDAEMNAALKLIRK